MTADGTADSLPLRRRLWMVFAAPRDLFARFGDRPPWVDVLVISTVIAVCAVLAMPAEFFLEQTVDAVDRRGRPVEITSDPAEIVRYGRYLGMLSAAASHPMIAFAVAGLLTLVFSVLGGSRTPFRIHLAIASHALLIPAAGTLLVLLVQMATGLTELQPTIGQLLGTRRVEGFLPALLGTINIFTLWMLGVLATGVAVVDPRRKWGSAAVALLLLYVGLAIVVTWLTLP